MQSQNVKALESLSLTCHLVGLINTFIGLSISFMLLIKQEFTQMHFGIYIFITGYAMVKIAQKISNVVTNEPVNS